LVRVSEFNAKLNLWGLGRKAEILKL
jgi:hypothetical protein